MASQHRIVAKEAGPVVADSTSAATCHTELPNTWLRQLPCSCLLKGLLLCLCHDPRYFPATQSDIPQLGLELVDGASFKIVPLPGEQHMGTWPQSLRGDLSLLTVRVFETVKLQASHVLLFV
jgi:hypothetical protein